MRPQSFEEIEEVINEAIPANLATAQCGWFDWEESIEGKIARASGVPGRQWQDPLGNVSGGMATRSDDFLAPGDATIDTCGFRTACRVGGPPFLEPLSCQRPLGSIDPQHPNGLEFGTPQPNPPSATGSGNLIDFTCGGGEMPEDGFVCPEIEETGVGEGGLCWYLNSYWNYPYFEYTYTINQDCFDVDDPSAPRPTYASCEITIFSDEPATCYEKTPDEITEAIGAEEIETPRYQIPSAGIDEPYTLTDIRQCCTHQSVHPGKLNGYDGPNTDPHDSDKGNNFVDNCTTCIGDECRYCIQVDTDGDGIPDGYGEDCPVSPQRPRRQYYPPWDEQVDECARQRFNYDPENDSYDIEGNRIPNYTNNENDVNGIFCFGFGGTRRGRAYRSYFRHYTAGYDRQSLSDELIVEDDAHKRDIPVSCYRFYSEGYWDGPAGYVKRDPKTHRVTTTHKNCVIAAYYPDDGSPIDGTDRNFWEMAESQQRVAGKVPLQEYEDFPALVRTAPFDEDTSLWDPRIANAFSLSTPVFHDLYNSDITLLLYQPADYAQLQPQLAQLDINHVYSTGAWLRSFDDTVKEETSERRGVVEWWQEFQSKAHALLNPAVVHLVIPPTWSIGLDPLDPLFTPPLREQNAGQIDPRMQPIDLQLRVTDDLLDQVKAFLAKSLMPEIVEEKIPVVVPLASPTEMRAYAEAWNGWIRQREAGGASVPAAASELAAKLEEYAIHIEAVRSMRGELSKISGQLLDVQKTIDDTIGTWINDDIVAGYVAFRTEQERLEVPRATWRSAERIYREMTDLHSLPWCRNDRFTPSLYSLLDTWFTPRGCLPYEEPLCTPTPLPQLPTAFLQQEPSFDFSQIKRSTGSIAIPVFDPIQIRIDTSLIAPPNSDAEDVTPPTLPDLPPIPIIPQKEFPMITIEGRPRLYIRPPTIDVDAVSQTVNDVRLTVARMRREYERFWTSLTAEPEPLFEQDCYAFNRGNCVHTEMELDERLTRIGARPGLQLKEDFLNMGLAPRANPAEYGYGPPTSVDDARCSPVDWACQFLSGRQEMPREGWEIYFPGEKELEDELCDFVISGDATGQQRVCVFNDSLSREEDSTQDLFPYAKGRNAIVPSFAIPMNSGSLIPLSN